MHDTQSNRTFNGIEVTWHDLHQVDGSVIVGESQSADGTVREAFLWTQGIGMVGLGDLVGGNFESRAQAVSADGSVVVGVGYVENTGNEAFRWTEAYGMQSISQLLIDGGIDLTGWLLSEVTHISDDGTVIVGWGTSPRGKGEAWMARIETPAPVPILAALPLLLSALGGLGFMGWRKKKVAS